MKKLVVFPMKIFNSPTLVFPELPWSITGMECSSWDRECGHGAVHPMMRNTSEVLDRKESAELVRDYVKWYDVKEPIEIVYNWDDKFDKKRQEEAIKFRILAQTQE